MKTATPKEIEAAVDEYMDACYGEASLSELQTKEVRQAFLSGIHWRDTEVLPVGGCEEAIRSMLGLDRERN